MLTKEQINETAEKEYPVNKESKFDRIDANKFDRNIWIKGVNFANNLNKEYIMKLVEDAYDEGVSDDSFTNNKQEYLLKIKNELEK